MGFYKINCVDKVKIFRFGRVFDQVYIVRFVYGDSGIVRSYELSNGNFFAPHEIVKV